MLGLDIRENISQQQQTPDIPASPARSQWTHGKLKKCKHIFPANFSKCVRFFIDTLAEAELFFINLPNREEEGDVNKNILKSTAKSSIQYSSNISALGIIVDQKKLCQPLRSITSETSRLFGLNFCRAPNENFVEFA